MPTVLDSRLAALRVLEAVLDRRQPFDHVLEHENLLAHLEPRDRAFARLLSATVLRRLGTLDGAIRGALTQDTLPKPIWHVLRLGLGQLRYLKTPPHAAISTSVDLANEVEPRLKGLVNAILRKHESLAYDETPSINLPSWLWTRWVEAYGEDKATAIAATALEEAPLDITVACDPAGWSGKLDARIMPLGTLRREAGGSVADMPGFAEGAWWVQDIAASLPVKLLLNSPLPRGEADAPGAAGEGTDGFNPLTQPSPRGRGEDRPLVFDLCAAPGGKTAQLAASGARVVAVDRSPQRLKRLQANMQRLKLDVMTQVADAAAFAWTEKADAILLDAPCLATGTLRRHPDIPYLKTQEDLEALVALQARLLDHAATLLKPGGTLVYCTCSLEPEEGERQVESFLARHPGFVRVPVTAAELPGMEMLVTLSGDVRALPHYLEGKGGMDGFYVARLAATPLA
jgi:16S rRNA (cytosine967-C5)-methyltransferase